MNTVWNFACGVAAKGAEGYATAALLSGMNPVFTAGVFAANEAVQRVISPILWGNLEYSWNRGRYDSMIKQVLSIAIVAGTVHALGYAPIVLTAAKATTIAYTILATTALSYLYSNQKGITADAEYNVLLDMGSVCGAVLTATAYGWSPIAFGAIAAANFIAPRINATFKQDSPNLEGLLGESLGGGATRAYKRTLVAVLTVGALSYAGQVAAAGDIRSRTSVAFVTALIGFVHA